MTDREKLEAALEVALSYGQIEGAWHKAWVIDQMVRIICGDDYEKQIELYCEGGEYEWDTGIAP